MIDEIRIDDLGVIGRAHVRLGPGLTVLTGETGAGKTMVLTALGLLLGGRADPATVRTGARSAAVEGRVLLPADSPALARAREAGADVDDDGTLVVLRTVGAGTADSPGRSRAFLGGRSVPQAVLADIAEELVTVHGQADQMRLRSAARQRAALDEFAGPEHAAVIAEHAATWAERGRVQAELDDLVTRAQERAREAELLRLGLAEVERVAPQPAEDLELTAEAERLGHAEDLRAAAAGAHTALVGDEDAADVGAAAVVLVEEARRSLEQAGHHDRALADLAARAAEAGYLLADLATELSAYVQDLQADPARLDAVQRRRAELTGLTRSYGEDVAAVLEWAQDASRRLLDLDGGQERVAALTAERDALDTRLRDLAATITATRTQAAGRLAQAVTDELVSLAMAGAHLEVAVRPADEPGPQGADQVEMLLVPHAGAPARPLGKGASGGELSRVMLALEVALATADGSGAATPGTFVFDEVDAGVGGRAATQVGERLARLARGTQVLVVTHLAQVAAFADRHLVVTKSVADGVDVVTESDVREVEGDARVRELARMLSGQDDSATARAHAAELLAQSVGR
ncbi:DNA repair protein RecN [Cellulomonas wangsupingiae]|uniref:DNA repair protein RecN n=1 Tax=Cellulomonas wangsupingiae TaxID=2968085 RepID=A0ABY5KB99_9CELL|nr:DNA repair protein RecN [Cellulomonas wangsupingiae]MCC2332998.1 DNA repair protein RecN [Cellulomonas wangsupingiae]MCM0640356.1 DNA repair protein RecN [Cellulomonas wangsupingiae]UUI66716.1 DNA repair protein RecN [Cellulomonas wangsupingiae]